MKLVVAATIALASCGWGQVVHPKSSFIMNVDYAQFKYADSAAYLELYYNFYPRLVTL